MKKIASLLFAGTLIFGSTNAQILSEQNVTINMDLQPVLQLSLEGPEVIDFSFTTIDQYRNGITRYGANVLKVSSSVSFDLWANGFSQGMNTGDQPNRYFDILGDYGAAAAGGLNNIPCAALELHQFPQNPVVAAAPAINCGGNATHFCVYCQCKFLDIGTDRKFPEYRTYDDFLAHALLIRDNFNINNVPLFSRSIWENKAFMFGPLHTDKALLQFTVSSMHRLIQRYDATYPQ